MNNGGNHIRKDLDPKGLLDPRAVLAVIGVLGAFGLQFFLVFRGSSSDMPPWVVGLVSSIVAFYFGYRSGDGS